MSKEKCTCGCNTDIITLDGMVFSDHTSKWMKKSEWDKMYKPKPKKMSKAKQILSVKELKNLARFLIDDGSNKEYTRGICELIADIDGIPEFPFH